MPSEFRGPEAPCAILKFRAGSPRVVGASRIIDHVNLFCADDETAKDKARKLAIGQAVELWDGARRIAIFQPSNPDP